jgi:hypothetical protein
MIVMSDVLELLYKISNPLKLEVDLINGEYNLKPFEDRIKKYSKVIQHCEKLLDLRLKFEKWLRKKRNIEFEGDCWNISSICAEYLGLKKIRPHILAIDGPMIAHLECVKFEPRKLTSCFVTPFNKIPKDKFEFWNNECSSFDEWCYFYSLYCSERFNVKPEKLKFYDLGAVSNGTEARRLINKAFPNYPNIVVLVDLVEVNKKLRSQL